MNLRTCIKMQTAIMLAILMTLSKIGTMKLVSEKKMLNLSERNSMK